MFRAGDKMDFGVSPGRFLHPLTVLRRDKTIVRAMDEQDRDRVSLQAVDRPHPAEGASEADSGADRRQIDQKARGMHGRRLALQDRNNIAESAVRNDEIDRRFLLQHRDRSGGPERFTVDAEKGGVRITLPAVHDHRPEIFPFPDGKGAECRRIKPVAAQVVDDDMKSLLQIHDGILHDAEPIARICVGENNVTVRIPGVLQELGMENIPVVAGHGIIRLFQRIIPGEVIMLLLPGA